MSEHSRIIEMSDLEKLEATVLEAYWYFFHRDQMNARIHNAKSVIKSSITRELGTAWCRLRKVRYGEICAASPEELQ